MHKSLWYTIPSKKFVVLSNRVRVKVVAILMETAYFVTFGMRAILILCVETLQTKQNGCFVKDKIFKFIFIYENYCMLNLISMEFTRV